MVQYLLTEGYELESESIFDKYINFEVLQDYVVQSKSWIMHFISLKNQIFSSDTVKRNQKMNRMNIKNNF